MLTPDTLFTTIEVPEGTGFMIHTFVCPINSDGTLTLPTGYTPEQQAALIAYFTYNNKHTRVRRGNSLREMSAEEHTLLFTAIETLKSPAQKLRERVVDFVLESHRPRGEHQTLRCTWFDKVDGVLPNDPPLCEVTISERPNYRPYASWYDTEYRVALLPDDQLAIVDSWPSRSNDDDEEDE